MKKEKKFIIRVVCLISVALTVIFCNNADCVYASGYITQRVTVTNPNSPLRIGGGDMFIAADRAEDGECFAAVSHYVDSTGKVWFGVERCGRVLYLSKSDCVISNELKTIPDRLFNDGERPTVYLSPSRQPHNAYAVGDTNEMEQMEQLCDILSDVLESEYGFNVIKAPSYMRIIKSGRPLDAYKNHADIYLAVHSNATASGKRCSGAEAYYYSECRQSRLLAENIVRELNAVSDFAVNGSCGAVSGMERFDGFGYGEVRDPSHYGMIAVLAEVDYHDNCDTAGMIINKKQSIAAALARAVAATLE